ncbi:MAG: hypothetical protein HWQ38_14815 [Nostoc sp. NMS7]|uniref:hypothetical protein n=1 Tax=Nostoc sp. NMS7 TaxID=2815391 RepID=UPI0025D0CCDD|nr:hypothetical protein [Nostoc sp. NMS7]MBN3947653.1 hypothetical protein [Nostoc sp. NMS7]
MGKKLPVWTMPYAPRVGTAIQPFQGGEIWNEDWLFQPSKNPKSEPGFKMAALKQRIFVCHLERASIQDLRIDNKYQIGIR